MKYKIKSFQYFIGLYKPLQNHLLVNYSCKYLEIVGLNAKHLRTPVFKSRTRFLIGLNFDWATLARNFM